MANPYPAIWQDEDLQVTRLGGQITFTDPSNQPGGGSGSVTSVAAGDSSITIGGTPTVAPTVAVTGLGVTTGKLADLAVTTGKLAANAVTAAKMGSGAATANWIPLADGSGGVAWGANPAVASVTAADSSIVIAGTGTAPTVRTSSIDVIAGAHATTADWSNNSHKITSIANGASAQDAAAFGQIPTALPPNGSAGGDLSGTYPNPSVIAARGVAISSTAPTANQVLTASDATHAAWATPAGGGNFVLITDTTLGADTASISFTSISGSYKSLLLVVALRSTRSATTDPILVQLNSDTTAGNYNSQRFEGSVSTTTTDTSVGTRAGMFMGTGTGASSPSGSFGSGTIILPNYADGNLKMSVAEVFAYFDTGANMASDRFGSVWLSTSAITTVTLIPQVGPNWKTGSRATLYALT